MNLFDRLPAGLFGVLTGKNNRRAWDLLVRLSERYFGPDSVPPFADGYLHDQVVKEIERLKREAEEARNKLIEARGEADSQQGIIKLLERKLSEKPTQVVVEKEVIPADYESLKEKSQRLDKKSADLEKEITTIKDRMKADIDRGVKSYLKERQDELDAMQGKLERLRDESEKCRQEIVGANRKEQELKAQVQAIDDANFALNKLAVALAGFEFMPEGHVLRQWQTLQQSLQDGSSAVKTFTSLRLAS